MSSGGEKRDAADVIFEIARGTDRGRRTRLRALLETLPREDVLPILTAEVDQCTDSRRFEKLATTLARVGGSEAVEVLAKHARTQRRFPGIAIQALSRCADDRVIPLIMDLAEFGRYSQRISAIRVLGRMREIRSVEVLCRIAMRDGQSLEYAAKHALHRKGGYSGIFSALLRDRELDRQEKLRTLRALEQTQLSWRVFKAEQALEKSLRSPRNSEKSEAESLLNHLRAQDKLLRPTSAAADATLLHSADYSPPDSDYLLRGSAEQQPANESVGVIRLLVRILRRAFLRT